MGSYGTLVALASSMASITKAEGINVVLILRADGSYQMPMVDKVKEEDHLSEGSGEAV